MLTPEPPLAKNKTLSLNIAVVTKNAKATWSLLHIYKKNTQSSWRTKSPRYSLEILRVASVVVDT